MKIKSMPAGQRPSVQRKYIVIDRTRYLPDRSVCPSSPAQPWSVYEDLSPLVEPPLATFTNDAAAFEYAATLSMEPSRD
jgi:hypothetical protein